MPKSPKGLKFQPFFLPPKADPFESVKWTRTDSKIDDIHGHSVFAQRDVEAPAGWSRLAVDIAASKYFRRRGVPAKFDSTGGETSIRQLISRVVETIRSQGLKAGYFATSADARVFERELSFLCLHQMAAFNSPVWFNCGLFHKYRIRGAAQLWQCQRGRPRAVPLRSAYEFPQSSACFILSLNDDLASIFTLAQIEALIFKFGSGSGTNFSRLRGKSEPLENGGESSGLIAFLEVLDRGAGATKSGGTTRRAAKMVILDVDHPEILEFIQWKSHEEKKAKELVKAGYSGGLDGEAYRTVSGQNSNNSIRVTDAFMRAVAGDQDWWTISRTSGQKDKKYRALDLWREIAVAAWECADPGLQFHDTINRWHTCPESGPIEASNPCSEYMFLSDSACNLASLNLVKFLKADGEFDCLAFAAAVRTIFVAQEILVEFSGYPTAAVAENSFKFRPLGLGFANLGGLLMRLGIAYDSNEGRAIAASITALMTGIAYQTNAELARTKGAFAGYKRNRSARLAVLSSHQAALAKIPGVKNGIWRESLAVIQLSAATAWAEALRLGRRFGFRNSQSTVLAPTGTIGLLMDCETTGIETDFALVKVKKMVGGGGVRMVNQAVPIALSKLGYPADVQVRLLRYLEEHGTFEGHPDLKLEHLPIFDCAQRLTPGGRCLSPAAHLEMMAAIQPFLSGAISKTINLPADAKPREIEEIYMRAWQLGLKAVAVYRDGAKETQPLNAAVLPPGGAPTCSSCGYSTVRTGNCFKCLNCGHSESCG